ncbi:hypothetical protein SLEP1_g44289 [Rubroshorea leprosula]|uniref:Reverse transcriptase Ty1/copia-type domain-containing protein n=1 Tax=Rubroshorea leprosula TaxID=152421 RepID=A0AAV5LFT9_9ROSI|nr:hypothetical protein SLEP1_g44289 [Rubroshorea leprosula]
MFPTCPPRVLAPSPLAASGNPIVAISSPATHDLSSHAGDPIATSSLIEAVEVPVVSSSISSDHAVNHGARSHSMVTRSQDGTCKVRVLPSLLATNCALQEPHNFKEASQDPNWCTVMAEEFSALLRNNTWSLVPHPSNANIVGSKWVYRIKQRANGSVERLKACLVAQGYMQQPTHPDYVCKLQKALYGLKQAPRASLMAYLLLYVDDIILTASSTLLLASTPLSPKLKITADGGALYHDSSLYRSIVGALQYLTFTRLDIAFAMSQVCQFMHKPTTFHFQAVKWILRYLKGTMDYGLQLYCHSSLSLHMFTDADWAGCIDTRQSVSGYCLFLGNSLISWSSKKQHTVARSSTEVEYHALANAAAEVLWVRQLLFKLYTFLPTAPVFFCDNFSAIYLSINPIQHQRTKNIEIDIHFVHEKITFGLLSVRHVSSYFQCANILTRALSLPLFHTQSQFERALYARSN